MSDLLKLENIRLRDGDIKAFPISHNLMAANTGKGDWGYVKIAVDNVSVGGLALEQLTGILYLVNIEEWKKESAAVMSEEFMKHVAEKLKLDNDKLVAERDLWRSKFIKADIERIAALKELDNSRIEQLQNDVINAEMNLQIMTNLFEEAKKMLRKCSPFQNDATGCFGCGTFFTSGHKPNCPYEKMIGGVE
jgi:hypothetical protein